jgi:hypothetical protein
MRALIRSAVGGSRRSAVVPNAMPQDLTPWEAGAIGTIAGYELGQEEMERQNREHIQQQMFNNNTINKFPGGNIGGGSSGNF